MGITLPGGEQSQICMGQSPGATQFKPQEPLCVFPEGLSQAKQDWLWLLEKSNPSVDKQSHFCSKED